MESGQPWTVRASRGAVRADFAQAKGAYERQYEIDDILAGRYD